MCIRDSDLLAREAELDRALGRIDRRQDQRLAQHATGIPRLGTGVVLVHQPRRERLVQRAPVGADPHRFVVAAGELDQLRDCLLYTSRCV